MAKKKKLQANTNKKAKSVVDLATSECNLKVYGKNAAVELGWKGGLKGGLASKKALKKQQRIDIAKKTAAVRWRAFNIGIIH